MTPWNKRKRTAPWRPNDQAPYQHPQRSPWAWMFYPGTLPYTSYDERDGMLHSGLAPQHPYVAVTDLPDLEPMPMHPVPQPSNEDLDRLFLEERIQMYSMVGFRTWQIPALNALPGPYGPGDHIPRHGGDIGWEIYQNNLLEVREHTWLTFFMKQRWFDLKENCYQTLEDPIPGLGDHPDNWWTVDNPYIWGQLSVSIEIANRILLQLLEERDPWLEAIMFQPYEQWKNHDVEVMEHHKKTGHNPWRIRMQKDYNKRQTKEHMTNQLSMLLAACIFGFQSENIGAGGLGSTFSIKDLQPDGPGPKFPAILVRVHVGYIRALCNNDLPYTERAQIQFALADTILHEIAHAICRARNLVLTGVPFGDEPFIANERSRELGFSFESHIFGGGLQLRPLPTDPWHFKGRNLVMLFQHRDCLLYGAEAVPPNWITDHPWDGTVVKRPQPAAWAAAFGTKFFWDHVVPFRQGSLSFKASTVFRSESQYWWRNLGERPYGAKRARLDHTDPYRGKYEVAHQIWQRRKIHWEALRPWYSVEYAKWCSTPWSMTGARIMIERFVEAHSRRDVIQCTAQAHQMGMHRAEFANHGGSAPLAWIFIALGHLMKAAIPPLENDYDERWSKGPGTHLYPNSSGMPPFIEMRGLTELEIDLRDHFPCSFMMTETVKKSDWDPAKKELENFKDMVDFETSLHPISNAWIQAALATWAEMSKWMDEKGEPSYGRWPPFNFEVPPYDNDRTFARVGALYRDVWTNRDLSPPGSPLLASAMDSYSFSLPEGDGNIIGGFRAPKYGAHPTGDDFLTPRANPIQLYTVGEFGDRVNTDDSTRIVEPDGVFGYNVYDITAFCQPTAAATGQDVRNRLIRCGRCGPSLVQDAKKHSKIAPWVRSLIKKSGLEEELLGSTENAEAQKIRSQLGKEDAPLVGKVLTGQRPEQIAEYDGRGGMPFWLVIRDCVYDLTTFETSHRDLDTLRSLADPATYGSKSSLEYRNAMLQKIEPHKCALVQNSPHNYQAQLQAFTLEMLARSDNPTYGCYTALDGYVYDLGPYLDSHPGGRQIIIKVLGREATEFEDWHTFDILDEVAHLRVGRLVPSMEAKFVEKYEVVIHDWVFDISGLGKDQSNVEKDNFIHEQVAELGGTDLSEAIKKKNDKTAAALAHLFQMKHRIVGRIYREETLREIPDGELKKHDKPNFSTGAWVAVDDHVYNITPIMIHGKTFYDHEMPPKYAGGVVDDADLAQWLMDNYKHYIIGKLVKGPAWPERKPVVEEENQGTRWQHEQTEPQKNPVPADIEQWAQDTKATAAEFRHQMALRFGWYADRQPDDPITPCIQLNRDGTNACPEFARPLKLIKFGDPVRAPYV